MKKIIVTIFIITSFLNSFCQNAKEDFAKVSNNLLAFQNMYMEMDYKVYANHFAQLPKETSHGVFRQKGNKIYQRVSNVQSIMNPKLTLHIDTFSKILMISDPIKLEDQKKEALKFNLDEILKKCSSVTSKQVTKNTIMYSLEYKENVVTEFSRCDIYIDKSTFFLSKFVMYYNQEMEVDENANGKKETPRLEIVFTKIDPNPKFKDSDFDEKQFVAQSGNKFVATSAYKKYKVVDNRYYTK